MVRVSIPAAPALAEQVRRQAQICDVSVASFCYTAILWWVQYIYPPNKTLPDKTLQSVPVAGRGQVDAAAT
jgi:hypothetical protein